MKHLRFAKPSGFSLAAAARFYAGFTPGCGMAAARQDGVAFAFGADGSYAPVGVALREDGEIIVADYEGDVAPAVLRGQLARMLGLEVDGAAWLGIADPAVRRLQQQFPGFFTAAKSSPYDAATWSIIAARIGIAQAAKVRLALIAAHGEDVLGLRAFPRPEKLLALERFPGLSAEKVVRLRGVAEAALAGELDADRLAALGEERALAQLQTLRGIGPWGASHIYFRGVAPIDALPHGEPRVLHAVAQAYDLPGVTQADLARIAEGWRPFRMWVAVLMMRSFAQTPAWATVPRSERAASRRRPSAARG